MAFQTMSRLLGRSRRRAASRERRPGRRFVRTLSYISLEERLMLAGILGTAESFAVLAGSTVTNTGPSVITGHVGVSPGSAVVGIPPGIVVPPGTIHAGDAVATQAQVDLTTAYNTLLALPAQVDLTGQNLGGLVLPPAVYSFATSAQLTGILTLNGLGNPNAQFVFQIGTTLTTASNSQILLINGANADNVFFAVGSSATFGTNSLGAGNIVALTSVTLNTGASLVNGRALARNGAVTLDNNIITIDAFDAGGVKFNDLDGDGVFDSGEPGLPGWTIYVDYNNDGALQPLVEPFAVTAADGSYALVDVVPGTWNVREVGQTGWTNSFPATSDAFGRFQSVVFTDAGTAVGVDFGNYLQTSAHGYVFNDLNDNGVDDTEPRLIGFSVNLAGVNGAGAPVALTVTSGIGGEYSFSGMAPGTYTVSAAFSAGFRSTTVNTPFTLTSGQEAVAYLTEAGLLLPAQVEVVTPALALGLAVSGLIVIGPGKNPTAPQFVQIVDEATGVVLFQFAPYGPTFQGGVRVVTGDLNGDGSAEIVVTPGWSILGDVRVYNPAGVLLTSFLPYGPTFDGGVHAAIADVNGDGVNDIITVPSIGPARVRVFLNTIVAGVPTFNAAAPYRDFLAFPASFIGGAVVDAVDMGSSPGATFNTTLPDQRAEIIVGSGAGMTATVKVFDVASLAASTPTFVPAASGSFTPFSTPSVNFQGGVSLDVGRFNADPIPDILVGAGVFGGSQVNVWAWNISPAATLSSLAINNVGFAAFSGSTRNWPVEVAAQDGDDDRIVDTILAVQGPGGTTGQIRAFNVVSASPLVVSGPVALPGTFPGPYYIDVVETSGLGPNQAGFTSADYDRDGRVTGNDFLIWQRTLGSTQALSADGNNNGVIDAADLQLWRDTYGDGADSAVGAVVALDEPEAPVAEKDAARETVGASASRVEQASSSRVDSYFLTLGAALPSPRAQRAAYRPLGVVTPRNRLSDELFLPTSSWATARPGRASIEAFNVHEAADGASDSLAATLDCAFEVF